MFHKKADGWARVSKLDEQAQHAFEQGDYAGAVYAFTRSEAEAETLTRNPPEDLDNGQGYFES